MHVVLATADLLSWLTKYYDSIFASNKNGMLDIDTDRLDWARDCSSGGLCWGSPGTRDSRSRPETEQD